MRNSLSPLYKVFLAGALLAVLLLALPVPAKDGEKAEIVDLSLEIDEQKVFVSFELAGALDEKLEQRVASGLATGFVYEIELVRLRKGWFNKNVETGTLQVTGMYNAVTREYLVNFKHDGDLVESLLVRDLTELYEALTRIERLEAFSLEGLKPELLVVRVRAVLGTRSILFFIPSIRATDWVESERFEIGPEGSPVDAAEEEE